MMTVVGGMMPLVYWTWHSGNLQTSMPEQVAHLRRSATPIAKLSSVHSLPMWLQRLMQFSSSIPVQRHKIHLHIGFGVGRSVQI